MSYVRTHNVIFSFLIKIDFHLFSLLHISKSLFRCFSAENAIDATQECMMVLENFLTSLVNEYAGTIMIS